MKSPPEEIANNIMFILNNLSTSNTGDKATELKNLLKPDYITWFVHHLVMKRITRESAFHPIYVHLIDYLDYPNIHRLVLHHAIITSEVSYFSSSH